MLLTAAPALAQRAGGSGGHGAGGASGHSGFGGGGRGGGGFGGHAGGGGGGYYYEPAIIYDNSGYCSPALIYQQDYRNYCGEIRRRPGREDARLAKRA